MTTLHSQVSGFLKRRVPLQWQAQSRLFGFSVESSHLYVVRTTYWKWPPAGKIPFPRDMTRLFMAIRRTHFFVDEQRESARDVKGKLAEKTIRFRYLGQKLKSGCLGSVNESERWRKANSSRKWTSVSWNSQSKAMAYKKKVVKCTLWNSCIFCWIVNSPQKRACNKSRYILREMYVNQHKVNGLTVVRKLSLAYFSIFFTDWLPPMTSYCRISDKLLWKKNKYKF